MVLYVAAGIGSEGPHAATISWVSQASFEPRLISVAMRKGTAICDTVLDSRRFSLHVVGTEQNDFAKAFFKVNQATDDAIAGYHYTLSESGLPIFDAASAWLECEVDGSRQPVGGSRCVHRTGDRQRLTATAYHAVGVEGYALALRRLKFLDPISGHAISGGRTMTLKPPTDVRVEALRLLSGGLFVLTSCAEDTVHAAAVSWVSQVSAEPALVLVALRRNSHLAQAVRNSHRFALNILGKEQEEIARSFLEHQVLSAAAADLVGEEFRMSAARCPLLTDALAWLECRFAAELQSPGDHSLILGEVTASGVRREGLPLSLLDTPWNYGGMAAS